LIVRRSRPMIGLRGRDSDGSWHWIEVGLDGRVIPNLP